MLMVEMRWLSALCIGMACFSRSFAAGIHALQWRCPQLLSPFETLSVGVSLSKTAARHHGRNLIQLHSDRSAKMATMTLTWLQECCQEDKETQEGDRQEAARASADFEQAEPQPDLSAEETPNPGAHLLSCSENQSQRAPPCDAISIFAVCYCGVKSMHAIFSYQHIFACIFSTR